MLSPAASRLAPSAAAQDGRRATRRHYRDGGLVLDRSVHGTTVYAQVAGFATWAADLVTWVSAGVPGTSVAAALEATAQAVAANVSQQRQASQS